MRDVQLRDLRGPGGLRLLRVRAAARAGNVARPPAAVRVPVRSRRCISPPAGSASSSTRCAGTKRSPTPSVTSAAPLFSVDERHRVRHPFQPRRLRRRQVSRDSGWVLLAWRVPVGSGSRLLVKADTGSRSRASPTCRCSGRRDARRILPRSPGEASRSAGSRDHGRAAGHRCARGERDPRTMPRCAGHRHALRPVRASPACRLVRILV